MVTRRAFVLSAVALLAAACGPSTSAGVRGVGTVLRAGGPFESDPPTPTPTTQPSPTPVPAAPTPTLGPIVPPEAVPPPTSAVSGVEAQSLVIPVPSGRAPAVAPLPPKRLVVPSIGVDARVIPLGTTLNRRGELVWETAPFAVGHHRGTAGPGQPGNMVLSGHISSPGEGGVFHRLPELEVGDGVIVMTEERQFLYQVTKTQTVLPQEVAVMGGSSAATATLITCVPDRVYSHRLVVSAKLVGQPVGSA